MSISPSLPAAATSWDWLHTVREDEFKKCPLSARTAKKPTGVSATFQLKVLRPYMVQAAEQSDVQMRQHLFKNYDIMELHELKAIVFAELSARQSPTTLCLSVRLLHS